MFNKDMTFAEAIAAHPTAVKTLSRLGFNCARCRGADIETIEQGALNYGCNLEELLAALEEAAREG